MSATVQLRCGDMFDGPCDLIVLPCSTAGTVTDLVQKRLKLYHLSYPERHMEFGQVDVRPFGGGENIAQFVAYAASVLGYSSSIDAVRSIGEKLGEFAIRNRSVRLIHAPLLGSGAGKLPPADSVKALRDGFLSRAPNGSTLVVSIMEKATFEIVRDALSGGATTAVKPLRVFISYTKSNPDHEEWVIALGTFLRRNGVNARLDVWHLRHGMDLPQWMCNELALADRVILVCNEEYAKRADGRLGGVGWETMLVQGDMARAGWESAKHLAIVHGEKVDDCVPLYLRSKYCLHWAGPIPDPAKQDTLLRELLQKMPEEPELGEPPVYL